jgi:hypothetical protein
MTIKKFDQVIKAPRLGQSGITPEQGCLIAKKNNLAGN